MFHFFEIDMITQKSANKRAGWRGYYKRFSLEGVDEPVQIVLVSANQCHKQKRYGRQKQSVLFGGNSVSEPISTVHFCPSIELCLFSDCGRGFNFAPRGSRAFKQNKLSFEKSLEKKGGFCTCVAALSISN
jgi:hypothetical protein